MRTAHLFAGAGGGMLADLILGHTPVLAVEQDPYCCDVLRDRRDDGWFPGLEVAEWDIRQFPFALWAGRVDCIAAGFPCQDISAAGTGEGISGARSGLFFEVMRAVDAIRPGLVFLENSPNIRTRGRDVVTREIVERGYRWRDGKIGAADVGAGHQRDRWFLLAANADGMRQLQQEGRQQKQWGWNSYRDASPADAACSRRRQEFSEHQGWPRDVRLLPDGRSGAITYASRERRDVVVSQQQTRQWLATNQWRVESPAHTLRPRLPEHLQPGALGAGESEAGQAIARHDCASSSRPDLASRRTIRAMRDYCEIHEWAPFDGGSSRMVDGLSAKSHRIKALGNAQVPLQAAAAWIALSQ